jgi:hypothetical protein
MKLLADSMLGSLGRWLRLMGYDTAIAQHEPDTELVRRARIEDRVILTRDRELTRRAGVRTLLIEHDTLQDQLAQVGQALNLPSPQPGTRCPRCNEPLQAASLTDVAGDVPPYVLRTQTSFHRCPACRCVYWRGTHWQRITERLARLQVVRTTRADEAG